MRLTICCLIWRDGSLSSSRDAEGLIRISYPATTPQILYDVVERKIRLVAAGLESGQILGVLGQAEAHGFVDQIGDRALRLDGFETEGAVEILIEVNGGALGIGHKLKGNVKAF